MLTTVQKFGELYTIDLKALDPGKGEFLFTATEQGKGIESIPVTLSKIAERTREGLHEKESDASSR